MIIYGSLIVSFIITLVFYIYSSKKITWWEFFVPILSTLLIVIIFKFTTDSARVNFKEYWGENIVSVFEEEPYNYWKTETCSRQVACGTDSKGNTQYCTEYYDCSHQEDVGPKWYGITVSGKSIYVSEKMYDRLKLQFNTQPIIVKIRDNYDSDDRCVSSRGTKFEGKDVGETSNIYQCNWDRKDHTAQPVFSQHLYVNKIKASDLSVFNIKVVDKKEADSLKLFTYPDFKNEFKFPTIIGDNPNDFIHEKYRRLNGKFGTSNKLRLWILIFKDKPFNISNYQENYWVRGNKNELVICIGIDKSRNIKWTHAFSWTYNQTLVSEVKQKALDLKVLNDQTYNQYYDYLNSNLDRFEKRSFKEFDYLTVEPVVWQIILSYIFAIIISIIMCLWIIRNDYE